MIKYYQTPKENNTAIHDLPLVFGDFCETCFFGENFVIIKVNVSEELHAQIKKDFIAEEMTEEEVQDIIQN